MRSVIFFAAGHVVVAVVVKGSGAALPGITTGRRKSIPDVVVNRGNHGILGDVVGPRIAVLGTGKSGRRNRIVEDFEYAVRIRHAEQSDNPVIVADRGVSAELGNPHGIPEKYISVYIPFDDRRIASGG